eukprot:jgi/Mesen1/9746/ME000698S09228
MVSASSVSIVNVIRVVVCIFGLPVSIYDEDQEQEQEEEQEEEQEQEKEQEQEQYPLSGAVHRSHFRIVGEKELLADLAAEEGGDLDDVSVTTCGVCRLQVKCQLEPYPYDAGSTAGGVVDHKATGGRQAMKHPGRRGVTTTADRKVAGLPAKKDAPPSKAKGVELKGRGGGKPPGDKQSGPPKSGALPEGFFDSKPPAAEKQSAVVAKSGGGCALPEGFFDKKPSPAEKPPSGASKGGASAPALPEGFFDSKEADQKARGVQVPKVNVQEELKEFQKLIKEDIREADTVQEEEAAEAADDREARENLAQRSFADRIEMLRQKKEEKRIARAKAAKEAAASKTLAQADQLKRKRENEDDEEDEDEPDDEDILLDWRAKRLQ